MKQEIFMAYKIHKQYRLFGYNYAEQGAYFITIVTKNRIHYFGEIEHGEMNFSEIGRFVLQNISDLETNITYLKIAEWVIMPNHIHFIAVIKNDVEASKIFVPITGLATLNPKSISSFSNHFKGRIKKWCNENNFENFQWQSRFHDRIIRNEEEYVNIANYIRANVEKWQNEQGRIM